MTNDDGQEYLNETVPLSYGDLLAKARAATPGPWIWNTNRALYGRGFPADANSLAFDNVAPTMIIETDSGYYPPDSADAAFIAAASPDVIIALVEKVERLEAGIRDFSKSILHGDSIHRAWLSEAAELWIKGKPIPPARAALETERKP